MSDTVPVPLVSAIIPTRNRAGLLAAALDSLRVQTLPQEQFEVLVVDDGSTDTTRNVCRDFQPRLPLRYFRIEHAGIAAAKNVGMFASAGRILLFFDDDDVAHAELLQQHVDAHRRWPDEAAAVLGYTTWAPWLEVTELMHFVTEVGRYLFSYPGITPGRPLDFTHFWGGRSSCKRSFVTRHGAFRQDFEFGCEDIELGYRLSRFGLKVYYEPRAISFMNRGVTLDEFCRRCERQGRAQFVFSELHPDPVVQDYCQIADVAMWPALARDLPQAMQELRRLDKVSVAGDEARRDLWQLYDFTFKAFKVKGIVEMAAERGLLAASAC